jgi:hypothetical protein
MISNFFIQKTATGAATAEKTPSEFYFSLLLPICNLSLKANIIKTHAFPYSFCHLHV